MYSSFYSFLSTAFLLLVESHSIKIVNKTFVTEIVMPRYNNLGENTDQMNKWCLWKVTKLKKKNISSPLDIKNETIDSDIEKFSCDITVEANSNNHKIGPMNTLKVSNVPTVYGSNEVSPV